VGGRSLCLCLCEEAREGDEDRGIYRELGSKGRVKSVTRGGGKSVMWVVGWDVVAK
jgi:hypothetical protein